MWVGFISDLLGNFSVVNVIGFKNREKFSEE